MLPRWLVCVMLLAAACKCASANPTGPQAPTCQRVDGTGWGSAGTVAVKTEVVAEGLEVPWGLAFLPGGDVLVTERPGRLRLIRGGQLLSASVATFSELGGGEGGLLGIAAHPDFASNRLIYLYITSRATGSTLNRVERWKLADDGLSATKDKDIITGIAGASNHDGGRLRFGPDGMLYVGTGDAATPARAQDVENPAGKILRLTPDGEVPADNPRPGVASYIWGIRNTQGFDWFEPKLLVVTDHGPSGELGRRHLDEVSLARPGDNLGWPDVSGCDSKEGTVSPLITFGTANPPGGAALYTGERIPQWKGSLLAGGLGSTHLHRYVFATDRSRVESHEVYFAGVHGRLREVVMGADGELYVTTSNCDGRGDCPSGKDAVLRVVPQ